MPGFSRVLIPVHQIDFETLEMAPATRCCKAFSFQMNQDDRHVLALFFCIVRFFPFYKKEHLMYQGREEAMHKDEVDFI